MLISATRTGAPWNKPGWLQEAAQRLVAGKQLMVEAAIPQLDTAGLSASSRMWSLGYQVQG